MALFILEFSGWNHPKLFRWFNSIWYILAISTKTILQYVLIYFWITLVAPVFGILAWRKAVKHNKILYVANERRDRWNED